MFWLCTVQYINVLTMYCTVHEANTLCCAHRMTGGFRCARFPIGSRQYGSNTLVDCVVGIHWKLKKTGIEYHIAGPEGWINHKTSKNIPVVLFCLENFCMFSTFRALSTLNMRAVYTVHDDRNKCSLEFSLWSTKTPSRRGFDGLHFKS
jgi:hypothetical protein